MNSLMVQQMMRTLQGEKDQAKADMDAPPKPIRQPRRKKAPEPEPESDSGESSSSYDSYESMEKIHKKFDDEPCEAVSPAMLKSKATKKEAIKYLESKECPKIPSLKKKQMHDGPASPAPETAPARKIVKKVKPVAAAPAPLPVPVAEPVAAPRVKKVKATPAPAPVAEAAPAAAAPKAKRPASEYAKLVGKYRKEKLSFADAAKKAKAELDAKKKSE